MVFLESVNSTAINATGRQQIPIISRVGSGWVKNVNHVQLWPMHLAYSRLMTYYEWRWLSNDTSSRGWRAANTGTDKPHRQTSTHKLSIS